MRVRSLLGIATLLLLLHQPTWLQAAEHDCMQLTDSQQKIKCLKEEIAKEEERAAAKRRAAANNQTNCMELSDGNQLMGCFWNNIQKLREENKRLQADVANLPSLQRRVNDLAVENRRLNEAIASLNNRIFVLGNEKLLTLSYFENLQTKIIIEPGQESSLFSNTAALPRGEYRIALWVNVQGHPDRTMDTKIEIYGYCPGCRTNHKWRRDNIIDEWIIYGRDWNDIYIDINVSKPSSFFTYHANRGFKIKNIGEKRLEIFAWGIIQKPHKKYIQVQ